MNDLIIMHFWKRQETYKKIRNLSSNKMGVKRVKIVEKQ